MRNRKPRSEAQERRGNRLNIESLETRLMLACVASENRICTELTEPLALPEERWQGKWQQFNIAGEITSNDRDEFTFIALEGDEFEFQIAADEWDRDVTTSISGQSKSEVNWRACWGCGSFEGDSLSTVTSLGLDVAETSGPIPGYRWVDGIRVNENGFARTSGNIVSMEALAVPNGDTINFTASMMAQVNDLVFNPPTFCYASCNVPRNIYTASVSYELSLESNYSVDSDILAAPTKSFTHYGGLDYSYELSRNFPNNGDSFDGTRQDVNQFQADVTRTPFFATIVIRDPNDVIVYQGDASSTKLPVQTSGKYTVEIFDALVNPGATEEQGLVRPYSATIGINYLSDLIRVRAGSFVPPTDFDSPALSFTYDAYENVNARLYWSSDNLVDSRGEIDAYLGVEYELDAGAAQTHTIPLWEISSRGDERPYWADYVSVFLNPDERVAESGDNPLGDNIESQVLVHEPSLGQWFGPIGDASKGLQKNEVFNTNLSIQNNSLVNHRFVFSEPQISMIRDGIDAGAMFLTPLREPGECFKQTGDCVESSRTGEMSVFVGAYQDEGVTDRLLVKWDWLPPIADPNAAGSTAEKLLDGFRRGGVPYLAIVKEWAALNNGPAYGDSAVDALSLINNAFSLLEGVDSLLFDAIFPDKEESLFLSAKYNVSVDSNSENMASFNEPNDDLLPAIFPIEERISASDVVPLLFIGVAEDRKDFLAGYQWETARAGVLNALSGILGILTRKNGVLGTIGVSYLQELATQRAIVAERDAYEFYQVAIDPPDYDYYSFSSDVNAPVFPSDTFDLITGQINFESQFVNAFSNATDRRDGAELNGDLSWRAFQDVERSGLLLNSLLASMDHVASTNAVEAMWAQLDFEVTADDISEISVNGLPADYESDLIGAGWTQSELSEYTQLLLDLEPIDLVWDDFQLVAMLQADLALTAQSAIQVVASAFEDNDLPFLNTVENLHADEIAHLAELKSQVMDGTGRPHPNATHRSNVEEYLNESWRVLASTGHWAELEDDISTALDALVSYANLDFSVEGLSTRVDTLVSDSLIDSVLGSQLTDRISDSASHILVAESLLAAEDLALAGSLVNDAWTTTSPELAGSLLGHISAIRHALLGERAAELPQSGPSAFGNESGTTSLVNAFATDNPESYSVHLLTQPPLGNVTVDYGNAGIGDDQFVYTSNASESGFDFFEYVVVRESDWMLSDVRRVDLVVGRELVIGAPVQETVANPTVFFVQHIGGNQLDLNLEDSVDVDVAELTPSLYGYYSESSATFEGPDSQLVAFTFANTDNAASTVDLDFTPSVEKTLPSYQLVIGQNHVGEGTYDFTASAGTVLVIDSRGGDFELIGPDGKQIYYYEGFSSNFSPALPVTGNYSLRVTSQNIHAPSFRILDTSWASEIVPGITYDASGNGADGMFLKWTAAVGDRLRFADNQISDNWTSHVDWTILTQPTISGWSNQPDAGMVNLWGYHTASFQDVYGQFRIFDGTAKSFVAGDTSSRRLGDGGVFYLWLEHTPDNYTFHLEIENNRDFGDAPPETSFPGGLAKFGGFHSVVSGVHLGESVDSDSRSIWNFSASSDTDDGVILPSVIFPGQETAIEITTSAAGFVTVYSDLRALGGGTAALAPILIDAPVVAGSNLLSLSIPLNVKAGLKYFRFRFSTQASLNFNENAPDGEVEDYRVIVASLGDANFDSSVNEADYEIWKSNFGTVGSGLWEQGDFNQNGIVEAADFTIWRDHADDHADIAAAATSLGSPRSTPTIAVGTLINQADEDYFSFEATAGTTYEIRFDAIGQLGSGNVRAELLDPNRRFITQVYGGSEFVWKAPVSGTYLVLAVSQLTLTEAGYSLQVQEVAEPNDDYGNTIATATSAPQTSLHGVLEYVGDSDFFAIPVSRGEVYQFTTSYSSTLVTLFQADGQVIELGNNFTSWEASFDGIVYARISADSQRWYWLTYLNETEDGPISVPGEIDIVRGAEIQLDANAGELFSIELLCEFDCDTYIEVYDEDYDNLLAENDDRHGLAAQVFFSAPEDGTYYIDAYATFGRLRVVSLASDDHGDNSNNATSASYNAINRGYIRDANDRDWFSIDVAEANSTLQFSAAFTGSDADEIYEHIINVYDVDGTTLLASDVDLLSWTAQNPGTYYVEVLSSGHETTPSVYNLEIHELVNWATHVIDFSNEYSTSDWGTIQITGTPDTFIYSDVDTAWNANYADGGPEYVTLGFATPLYSNGAIIRENFANGFVTKVEAIDADTGEYTTVWEGDDPSPRGQVYDWLVEWGTTDYLVNGLRIHIHKNATPVDWEALDAVQLQGSTVMPTPVGAGDVNDDGDVNSTDLGLLLNNFGDVNGLDWGGGNLNGDQNVDSTDLGLLLNQFGYESFALAAGTGYTPSRSRLDVNGDGVVSPIDALRIINSFSSSQESETSNLNLLDVNQDGSVTPLDVQHVVDAIKEKPLQLALADRVLAVHGSADESDSEDAEEEFTPAVIDDVLAVTWR